MVAAFRLGMPLLALVFSTHATKDEAVRAAIAGAQQVQPSQVNVRKEDG